MNKDERIQYLKTHKIFSDLTPKQIAVLADHAQERTIESGELLFRQEDAAKHFFVMLDGSIEVGVPAVVGPTLTVQSLVTDDVLGWSWLIPPYKWTFEAQVRKDSRILEFDGSALLSHCESHKSFGYALMKLFAGLMSERLHAARIKMMDNWAPAGWA